jgi:hypothetical protein
MNAATTALRSNERLISKSGRGARRNAKALLSVSISIIALERLKRQRFLKGGDMRYRIASIALPIIIQFLGCATTSKDQTEATQRQLNQTVDEFKSLVAHSADTIDPVLLRYILNNSKSLDEANRRLRHQVAKAKVHHPSTAYRLTLKSDSECVATHVHVTLYRREETDHGIRMVPARTLFSVNGNSAPGSIVYVDATELGAGRYVVRRGPVGFIAACPAKNGAVDYRFTIDRKAKGDQWETILSESVAGPFERTTGAELGHPRDTEFWIRMTSEDGES